MKQLLTKRYKQFPTRNAKQRAFKLWFQQRAAPSLQRVCTITITIAAWKRQILQLAQAHDIDVARPRSASSWLHCACVPAPRGHNCCCKATRNIANASQTSRSYAPPCCAAGRPPSCTASGSSWPTGCTEACGMLREP